uniref:Histone-lysine N-methyltransferase SETMAR n=1 Tax=Schistocephalus solidus TaxID=70667 RepID=A0A0V0J8F2_SCHSO
MIETLDVSSSAVSDYLMQNSKVKKPDKCVQHELNENQRVRCSLCLRNSNIPCLKQRSFQDDTVEGKGLRIREATSYSLNVLHTNHHFFSVSSTIFKQHLHEK